MSPYLHHIPGRIRLRCALLRNRPDQAETIRRSLYELDGIKAVHINKHASSITVYYDHENLKLENILTTLRDHGCLESSRLSGSRHQVEAKAGSMFGKALLDTVLAGTLERSVMSLVAMLR